MKSDEHPSANITSNSHMSHKTEAIKGLCIGLTRQPIKAQKQVKSGESSIMGELISSIG